jgi:hypothetical protein
MLTMLRRQGSRALLDTDLELFVRQREIEKASLEFLVVLTEEVITR